jgi:hypothetical protein
VKITLWQGPPLHLSTQAISNSAAYAKGIKGGFVAATRATVLPHHGGNTGQLTEHQHDTQGVDESLAAGAVPSEDSWTRRLKERWLAVAAGGTSPP